ncbi:MAG TPA: hypothetical protein VJ722_02230 [Rhodanobacteraceae bacterium]|nr:hypothetical protein [Rhodanobacteraceae bacterium]
MPGTGPNPDDSFESSPQRRAIRWDAVAAIIASLVGLLALVVAGYTAYIQRQQVRAQVWPYLIIGNDDLSQSLTVQNKGVGPAVVRSVEVRIDGRPQPDWIHVVAALGLPRRHFNQTTVNRDVLSPGEELQAIHFPDKELWQRFHDAAFGRLAMDVCFCSTLDECWMSSNRNIVGPATMPLQLRVQSVGQCPRLPPAEVFNN